ncbi:hypothetical protein BDV12DRAFT_189777 [Aspergillus spectabilis]
MEDHNLDIITARSFVCHFPGCNASYRRKEHMTRHSAQHVDRGSFGCSICGKQFGRRNTLRRHVRQAHKVVEPAFRIRACQKCREMKLRCHGGAPCTECSRRQSVCSLAGDNPTTLDMERRVFRSSNRTDTEQRAIGKYFELFDPHWPFVHRGTFKQQQETPLLVQSVVAIGLWMSGERVARSAAIELHTVLGSAIMQQRVCMTSFVCNNFFNNIKIDRTSGSAHTPPDSAGSCRWPIPLYQSILLHILFCAISDGNVSIGPDLKPVLPSAAATPLGVLVASCRRLRMFHYPSILAQFRAAHLASYIWLCTEEIKRFNITLFRVGRRFSGSSDQSTPRVRPEELQFPPPAHDEPWNAVCQEDWNTVLAKSARKIDEFDGPLENFWISNSAALVQSID